MSVAQIIWFILCVVAAYFVGKFRGFKDGARSADEIIDSRNREIDELYRTGKAEMVISYHPIKKQWVQNQTRQGRIK